MPHDTLVELKRLVRIKGEEMLPSIFVEEEAAFVGLEWPFRHGRSGQRREEGRHERQDHHGYNHPDNDFDPPVISSCHWSLQYWRRGFDPGGLGYESPRS
jgi:hypothetical protein